MIIKDKRLAAGAALIIAAILLSTHQQLDVRAALQEGLAIVLFFLGLFTEHKEEKND